MYHLREVHHGPLDQTSESCPLLPIHPHVTTDFHSVLFVLEPDWQMISESIVRVFPYALHAVFQ
jgi:hypothetical protein